MPTTKEELLISVANYRVVRKVPKDSISITLERGNRISTASFTIEDAGGLTIKRWSPVYIYSATASVGLFFGFVTAFTRRKRGRKIDVEIEASSSQILLQKSYVNNTYVGLDTEILDDILADGIPDVSNYFDFSGATDVFDTDITLPSPDISILDAMNGLAAKTGANWSFDTGAPIRENLVYNPSFEANMNYYGFMPSAGTILQGWATAVGWAVGDVVWNIGYGETAGGVRLTSRGNKAFMRLSRASDVATLTIPYTKVDNQWLYYTYRCKKTSAANVSSQVEIALYDTSGVYQVNFFTSGSSFTLTTGSWVTRGYYLAIDAINLDGYPDSGYLDINIGFNSTAAFTVDIDNVLTEIFVDETEPNNPAVTVDRAWFYGDSPNCEWTDTAYASASLQYTPSNLNWGDTPPDAPFDIDIGTSDSVEDFEYSTNAEDGANTVIVNGGTENVYTEYTYPGNGVLTHFDLEQRYYPLTGGTYPTVYRNTGTDLAPNWTEQVVDNWNSGAFGVTEVLYNPEEHWLEWDTAPDDLKRSWKVVGYLRRRIKIIVQDEQTIIDDEVAIGDSIYDDGIITEDDAIAAGEAELDQHAAPESVAFSTYQSGLLPGQSITITDAETSLAVEMIIERVRRKYLGGGYALFEVEAGTYTSDVADMIAETYKMAQKKTPEQSAAAAITVRMLWDDDSLILTDDNTMNLYDQE